MGRARSTSTRAWEDEDVGHRLSVLVPVRNRSVLAVLPREIITLERAVNHEEREEKQIWIQLDTKLP